MILGWKVLGHAQRFGSSIITYANDLVICCRHDADTALVALRDLVSRLKLTLNEQK